jgi:hypothetical protein
MQQLESLGWLIAHEKGKWTVNPRCHQLYAEKAIEEHDRRVKAREMITHIVKGGDNGDK